MKFVCTVCGYVYEGDAAPAECPVCHVGADKFKKVEGDLTLAAEHEYGVYAKTVKNNAEISEEDKKYIFDQLKANFEGECSEVGMYLCMARIAHREGYPEIGLYWEKAGTLRQIFWLILSQLNIFPSKKRHHWRFLFSIYFLQKQSRYRS